MTDDPITNRLTCIRNTNTTLYALTNSRFSYLLTTVNH